MLARLQGFNLSSSSNGVLKLRLRMSTIVLNKNNLFLPLMKKDAKLKAILDSGSEDIAI